MSKRRKPLKIHISTEAKKSHWSVGGLVLAAATLLGGLAVVVPRVAVSPPSAPVDPSNILSASFDIVNTGFLPLKDVGISVYVLSLSAPGTLRPLTIEGTQNSDGGQNFLHFVNPTWQHHELGLDERLTINPESQIRGSVTTADMALGVSYKPWLIPIRLEKRFRFVAMKDGVGSIYWRSWPLNEPAPAN